MKNRKWVDWQKLCNVSLWERPADVVDFLRGQGYMQPDCFLPTMKALRCGLARVTVQGEQQRVLWNRTRYLSVCRDARRAARRQTQASETE